jgi:hypothetical protein
MSMNVTVPKEHMESIVPTLVLIVIMKIGTQSVLMVLLVMVHVFVNLDWFSTQLAFAIVQKVHLVQIVNPTVHPVLVI